MGLREKWEGFKERRGEEKEKKRLLEEEERLFREQQAEGELGPAVLSPKERLAQEETERRTRESAAGAARKARETERRRRPGIAREATEAFEEARAAEERAKILETELYGKPHAAPEEILRDRWGREVGRRFLGGGRREEAARLEGFQRRYAKTATELAEERAQEALEETKARRRKKKTERLTSPLVSAAGGLAKGLIGGIEGVGRSVGGMGVDIRPYTFDKPPDVMPRGKGLSVLPQRRSEEETPRPEVPGMGSQEIPRLDIRGASITRTPLFPQKPKHPGKKKKKNGGKNTYEDQMRRLRKMLF